MFTANNTQKYGGCSYKAGSICTQADVGISNCDQPLEEVKVGFIIVILEAITAMRVVLCVMHAIS